MTRSIQPNPCDQFQGYSYDCRNKTIAAQIAKGEKGVRVISPSEQHVATLLNEGAPYPTPAEADEFLRAVADSVRVAV